MDRPLPYTLDPDTGGFFAAARTGTLAVCVCSRCRNPVHLPRSMCNSCYAPTEWRVVGSTGRLITYTIVEQQVHPAFPTPYTVVLVDLDEAPGVRLLGRLDGAHDLPIGTPMTATFPHDEGSDTVVPNWRPTAAIEQMPGLDVGSERNASNRRG